MQNDGWDSYFVFPTLYLQLSDVAFRWLLIFRILKWVVVSASYVQYMQEQLDFEVKYT